MSNTDKAITVGELIEQLSKLPKDSYVYTEGCDCIGPGYGVDTGFEESYLKRGYIVIGRDDNITEANSTKRQED